MTDPWTAPWLEVDGGYSEPFPTGVVERTATVAVGLTGFLLSHFYLDFSAGLNWVRNFQNYPDNDRSAPFMQLKVPSFLSTRLNVE